jgi:hypothetical protein
LLSRQVPGRPARPVQVRVEEQQALQKLSHDDRAIGQPGDAFAEQNRRRRGDGDTGRRDAVEVDRAENPGAMVDERETIAGPSFGLRVNCLIREGSDELDGERRGPAIMGVSRIASRSPLAR